MRAALAESILRDEAARVHPALKAPVCAIEDSLAYAYALFRFLAVAAGLIAALTLVWRPRSCTASSPVPTCILETKLQGMAVL
jgi:hypothetical protein